ncbi:STAS domain-containing protein [Actinomycetospora cinnamomea]|uniref:Stage II sporulation protein AA (Anti-sigma F factor antagonist) n=1 Tax=Actinomycetospora cinnamomea TaxID=663609 RepID=A0A2U1FPP4_9PSEU|nr:STAS domain-containing protein [Actinomycetospora cinnamomea]PVZ14165.1 stage II sporulation protein AA (anti-sigma F factor antagonist) [Actinomycetospora cinnamomea]
MTTATVVVHPEGACVRIAISGEIDLENAETVEEQLAAAIPNEAAVVVLELGELQYLDSAGLRVLFALAARLEVLQILLRVHVPPGSPARRVLQLSGFEGVAALEG